MDVAEQVLLRQRHEFRKGPGNRVLDKSGHAQTPFLGPDIGLRAQIEHGPILHFLLTRRQTSRVRAICASGQQPALFRPFLLGADQLHLDGADKLRIFRFATAHSRPFARIKRALSRAQSRDFSVSRLSWSFLPRATPSSSLAIPFSVK